MKLPEEKIKKILIVRPDAIGDIVLITPAIHALKEHFPKAKISILVQEYTAPVARAIPDIDEVLIDDIKAGRAGSLRDFLAYVKRIRAMKFDLSVDFYSFNLKHTLLQFLAGIPYRVGDKSRFFLGFFYNCGKVLRYKDYSKHIVDLHLDLIKTIGVEAKAPRLKINVPEMKFAGIDDHDFVIGIHPGCTSSRLWEEEKYARTIDALQEKFQAKVVLTGGPKERALGDRIIAACRHKPLDLIAKTTLPELMALIKRFNIYIGADTGPTHLASAIGTPVVLLILAKNVKPVRWGSYGSRHIILYAHPQAQCPIFCDAGRCREDYCSRVITPEMIVAAVQQLREGKTFTREDWQRLSCNVLLIYDKNNRPKAEQVAGILKQQGYHYVLKPAEELKGIKGILQTIETDNILVIHHFGKKGLLTAWLANLLSGIYTTNATVLVRGFNNEDLFAKYNKAFETSLI